MHFDIAEVIRQKQQKQPRTISIENGKQVEITMSNGTVVVTTSFSPGPRAEEEIEPAEIALMDD